MRTGSRIMACLFAMAFTTAAWAEYKIVPPATNPESMLQAARAPVRSGRFMSFRSLAAQIDNQVVANLLTDTPSRRNEIPLTVLTGEVTHCEGETCTVPLTLRAEAEGPVTLAFAVANAKGELSEVRHAECGTGICSVSLILERGRNTVSVGVVDGLSQTTAYTTLRVNAVRAVAQAGKTEWF